MTVVIDPFDEELGLKVPGVGADIVISSHDHHDHNNVKAIKGSPFIIESPGEYDIKGVYIQGISAFHDKVQGKERGRVTLFIIEAEEMKICHLSDLNQQELTEDQLEKVGQADILMVPGGGTYTLDAQGAAKVISQIEPKIVIPMHYQVPKLKVKLEDLEKFLKVMGQKSLESQPKLTIKKKDLPEEGMNVIVLKS